MQGRFKRDGGAADDPEPRGGAGRGAEPRLPEDAVTVASGQPGPKAGRPADATAPTQTGDVEPPATGSSQGKHASRLAMRNWSIRTRLVSLLALPVVAATTLGAVRIQDSLNNVSQLDHMKLLTEMTGHATKLSDALQNERDSAAGPLTSQHPKDDQVIASREATDREIQGFHDATDNISADDPALVGVRSTVLDITRQLQNLKQLRSAAYSNTNYISQTVAGYDQLINSLLSLSQDMAQATSNTDMIRNTRALAAFTAAKEYDSIQRAVISAALANPNGAQLSASDRQYAQSAADSENSAIKRFSEIYGSGSAELMKALDGGNVVISQADQYRDRVLKTQNGISQEHKSYLDWYDQADTKMQEMSRIEAELLDQMQQKALTLRSDAQQEALLNGALILLVLGVSLVGAFVVARSMIRSLRRLQDTAKDVANKRLPDLVKQLSEADPQDVDTSVESIGITSRDEIGQVARAFDDVHREAVRLAAEQALLRGNVNAMFTNLSRRSQGLIQRQLSLISELESREADPDQLSNLFKLDHLATRMRRNGENLLVLAGEEPGRRWTRPVPLVDVLRAAASEVEQYERIELTSVPSAEVAGRVVNDLVHLLAELLENATSFSSPQTKVRVTGHALPDGRVLIEIHDTGIGLSPEDLADINERLANPPTVDVSVSRRMGLFVVGRLSLRHGIRIQLRPSDSGGTTALVMLPVDLTQGVAKPGAGQGKRGGPGAPSGPGGKEAQGRGGSLEGGGIGSRGLPGRGAGLGRTSQLGAPAAGPRGQVPGGPRPALTGRDGFGQEPPQPRTDSGPSVPQPAAVPGGADRPGPSWAHGERGAEVPRGHDEVDTTQSFERPDFDAPRRGRRDSAGAGAPGRDAGYREASATASIPVVPGARDDSGTAEIPAVPGARGGAGDSGAGRRPDAGYPQGTGEFPVAGEQGYGQSMPSGEFQVPPQAGSGADVFGPPARRGRQGGPAGDRFAAPRGDRAPRAFDGQGGNPFGRGARGPMPGQGGQAPQAPAPAPAPQRRPEAELPPVAEPMALPPATSPGDGRSPIYESLESDWFRGQREAGMPQGGFDSSGGQPPRPARRPAPEAPPAQPQGPAPQRARAEETAEWRVSPNDERWRRAEQIREPSAGGVTPSGLPRRVPRANLVPGTAQETTQSGPQVSRAPDDVRGRLTNLRRGIQQGRSAGSGGTDGRGFGTSYQQER